MIRDLLKMVMMKVALTGLRGSHWIDQGTEHSTQQVVNKFTLNTTSSSLCIFYITLVFMSLQTFPFKKWENMEVGREN